MIENNIKPTEKQMDDIKVLLSGFIGRTTSLFKDLPYDKNDTKNLSVNIKANQKIISNIAKYINKFKNDLVEKKTTKKRTKI